MKPPAARRGREVGCVQSSARRIVCARVRRSRRLSDLGEELVRQLRRVLRAARRARPAHHRATPRRSCSRTSPTSSTITSPTTCCASGSTRASACSSRRPKRSTIPIVSSRRPSCSTRAPALSFLRDPMWAFGCFYGVEANWPPECRLHLEINRARGADEHTLEYWTGHADRRRSSFRRVARDARVDVSIRSGSCRRRRRRDDPVAAALADVRRDLASRDRERTAQ